MKKALTLLFIAASVLAASATTETGTKPTTATTVKAAPAAKVDTLIITGRITEIPGTFAPNDLYNYVYIMKYRVLKVMQGSCDEKEILVGVYNPLIPRGKIKDKMAKLALGNVDKFEEGAKHTLTLIKPIDHVWKDAVEDEYTDSEMTKYYALKVNVLK